MMRHRVFAGGIFLFIAGTLALGGTGTAAQQATSPGAQAQGQSPSPAPSPQYDPNAEAIVTGLKGVATGTQSALGSFSDNARTQLIQNALGAAIDTAADKSKVKLDVSDVAILCDVRESYVEAKAHTDDITGVTTALDAIATPAAVNTLGDALGIVFKNYSFSVKDYSPSAPAGATRDACIADLEAWAYSYYDRKRLEHHLAAASPTTAATAATGGIDALFGDLSSVSGIISAVVAIVTPIATYAAEQKDQAARQAAIDKYLYDPDPKHNGNKNIESLLAEARALATAGSDLATQARYTALGQFEEKLAALREMPIDLTKSNGGGQSCDKAMTTYAGDSEKIPLKTSADTAAGGTALSFKAVPSWIKPGMNIYLSGGATADAAVEGLGGSVAITVAAPKGGIAKGTAITFASADPKTLADKVTLNTNAATPEGKKSLSFDMLPAWIVAGVKVMVAEPTLSGSVASVTYTSVVMSNAASGSGVRDGATVQFTFSTASEGYVSCFAQASKQVSQAVSDVVKAAGGYDTAAQAQVSSDALNAKLDKIATATQKSLPWPASTKSAAAEDAAELAAFGDAMQKAFAQSNITALQNALDAAKKQFDIK